MGPEEERDHQERSHLFHHLRSLFVSDDSTFGVGERTGPGSYCEALTNPAFESSSSSSLSDAGATLSSLDWMLVSFSTSFGMLQSHPRRSSD